MTVRPPDPGTDLARDARGATALEFAVTAPLVVLLLVAVFDLAILLVGASALDAGARAATRYGLTGWIEEANQADPDYRRSRIVEILAQHICPASLTTTSSPVCYWTAEGLPIDHRPAGATLVLRTAVLGDLQGLGTPDPVGALPDDAAWDAGGRDDVVVYEVVMAQRVWTPMLQAVMGKSILHRARVVVRNESF